MVVGGNGNNLTEKMNPLIDTGNVTVNAFNAIKDKEKADANFMLGRDDKTVWTSPNFKVKVKAWTKDDKKTHTYFHSLSIDVNVDDFMGTAELKCPYDSDLMEYWEPIRQTVVIYGANRGDYKILFIGRVRGVKQDGYELVIEFQNYAWKFKQLVTQSYAKDNVLGKDGYTIMRLMFEALKIDSWVISESAKKRLKEVGINQDGNLTVNGKEIEKIPDLLKRIEASDPSKLVNKNTLNNKLREKYLHNINHINYTLKYEKPSPVMKKIASEGSYSAGSNVYSNPYGSASSAGTSTANNFASGYQQQNGVNTLCSKPTISQICPGVPSSLWSAMETVYLYNRDCVGYYQNAKDRIIAFAKNYPNTYLGKGGPNDCLITMSKYPTKRKDGHGNIAKEIQPIAFSYANTNKYLGTPKQQQQLMTSISNLGTAASNFVSNIGNSLSAAARNGLNWVTKTASNVRWW